MSGGARTAVAIAWQQATGGRGWPIPLISLFVLAEQQVWFDRW